MPAKNLNVQGAYSLGSSIDKNRTGKHNFGTVEDPDEHPVYLCSISVSAETKYEQGTSGAIRRIVQPPIRVDLIGADGNAYKESMWTDAEIAAALVAAWDTANTTIKANYGTGL